MAEADAAMTPDQAIAVLHETRDYRERVTARAVGIIWLVWGASLAMLALADLTLLFGSDLAGLPFPDALMGVFIVLFVAFGGAITNMVWRAHALENDPQTRPWITYLVAAALVVLSIGAVNIVEPRLFAPMGWQTPTRISPFLWLVADGALVLAFVMRRHVSMVPGLIGAAIAIAMEVAMVVIDVPQTAANDLFWGAGVVVDTMLVFGIAGLWYYLRG